MRAVDRDLIRGGHYGQRSCEPHPKAEHMAAPTNAANVKKALANSEPSTHVQILWGERRGHGTFGAVQQLPTELPPCRNNIVILTRAGPSPPSSRIAPSSP